MFGDPVGIWTGDAYLAMTLQGAARYSIPVSKISKNTTNVMTLSNEKPQKNAKACQAFRLDLTQDEFDREFFGQILEHSDGNTDVLRRQAELLSRAGDHEMALHLDRRLADRCPDDPVVFYNLACSLSMTGLVGEAIEALSRALTQGYNDFAHIEADADLDPLRDLPSFQELLRRRMTDNDLRII